MTETSMEVRASEIRPGDFLDQIDPAIVRGPRGGKYRWEGVRVQSRVVAVEQHARGFRITPSTGAAFSLPGNLADLTVAQVRRSESTEIVKHLDDDALLAACESDERALKLAASAELARRTAPTNLDWGRDG